MLWILLEGRNNRSGASQRGSITVSSLSCVKLRQLFAISLPAPIPEPARHGAIVNLGEQVRHRIPRLDRRPQQRIGRGKARLDHPVSQPVHPPEPACNMVMKFGALLLGENMPVWPLIIMAAGMPLWPFIIMAAGGTAFGLGVGLIFGYLLGCRSQARQVGFPIVPLAAIAPDAEKELVDLVRAGRKIEAIKRYRDFTGAGLKVAKEFIERL